MAQKVVSPGRGHGPSGPPAAPPDRRVQVAIGSLALLLVLGCSGTLAAQHFNTANATSGPTPTRTTATAPATPSRGPTGQEPDPEVSQVGVVAISAPSPAAERVATMFDKYFAAVNAGDYDAVLGLYDPAGVLDTTDEAKAQQFVADISTTQDDEVVLGAVSDHGATVTAEITFRSRQAAGKGPRSAPDQTCTIWSLRYTLTDAAGQLLIKKGTGDHEPC